MTDEPVAYRVDSTADVPFDRVPVMCTRCCAVYAVRQEPWPTATPGQDRGEFESEMDEAHQRTRSRRHLRRAAMILHRLWPPGWLADEPPPVRISWGFGWSTWLLGAQLERHPHEWTLQLHLGPFALFVERVK